MSGNVERGAGRLGVRVRRLRPGEPADSRTRHPSAAAAASPPERDPLGKMALYSGDRRQPPLGTLIVDCSTCRRETPVSPLQLARSAFPFSVHLPFVRKYHSFMRCPSCGRRTWVRVRWEP